MYIKVLNNDSTTTPVKFIGNFEVFYPQKKQTVDTTTTTTTTPHNTDNETNPISTNVIVDETQSITSQTSMGLNMNVSDKANEQNTTIISEVKTLISKIYNFISSLFSKNK